jgi:hypothetical protein
VQLVCCFCCRSDLLLLLVAVVRPMPGLVNMTIAAWLKIAFPKLKPHYPAAVAAAAAAKAHTRFCQQDHLQRQHPTGLELASLRFKKHYADGGGRGSRRDQRHVCNSVTEWGHQPAVQALQSDWVSGEGVAGGGSG